MKNLLNKNGSTNQMENWLTYRQLDPSSRQVGHDRGRIQGRIQTAGTPRNRRWGRADHASGGRAVPATAAAVLLAASNRARTRSAIAASLSPIFSMICSKNITGSFRSRKTFKNAVEKHCVHGSQKFAVCGRKMYKLFADFTLCQLVDFLRLYFQD